MKKLNKKLLRDLKSSKWQFLAAAMVVVLGVAFFGAYYMAFQNLGNSYQYTYDELNFMDFTVKLQEAPEGVVKEVEKVQGVKAAAGRINKDLGLHVPGMPGMASKQVVVRVISLPADKRPTVNDVYVVKGSYFPKGAGKEVLMETKFAEYHNYRPGEQVHVVVNGEEIKFRIRGVVSSPEYIWVVKSKQEILATARTFGVLFVPEEQVQKILGMEGTINEVSVTVKDSADRKEVMNRVEKVLEPYGVYEVIPRNKWPSTEMLKMDLDSFSSIAIMFSAFFLLIAGMVIYVILTRMIHTQRPQIGEMMAEGYSRKDILLHYMGFSFAIGIGGSILGSILGYLLSVELTRMYASILGLPLLEIQPYWGTIGVGALFGMLSSVIAGFIPAYSITRMSPAQAMQGELPVAGRITPIERLFPSISRWPMIWKMPFRNVFRNRRRTFYTAMGVASAVSLILVSNAFFDSFYTAIDQQYYQIQAYDARVSFTQPQSMDRITEIKEIGGVRDVQPILEVPVRLKSGSESYSTVLVGIPAQQDLYNLFDLKGRPTLVRENRVLLGRGLRGNFTVKAGDTIEVEGPGKKAMIKVGGFVNEPIASMGFMPLGEVQDTFGAQDAITGAMVRVEPGKMSEVKPKLYDLPSSYVEILSQTRKDIETLMQLFIGFIGIMVVFGAFLAFATIFNMTTVNILERRQEIATMRTIGMTRKEVATVITIENILMGVMGIVIGILLGYYLSIYFIGIYQSDLFSMDTVIYNRTYALTIVSILIVLLLSQIPGIRYVNRLDLAKVTKERIG